jgi:hypothetical protein
MQQYHQVKPSRSQCILLLLAHFVAAAVIYFYLATPFLKWAGMAAMAVSALIECRRLIQHGNMRLRVLPQRASIELEQGGQPYFYFKYKVYETRWFAILKLIDTDTHRTLILNPDCFQSLESYRRCRYDLRHLGASDAA